MFGCVFHHVDDGLAVAAAIVSQALTQVLVPLLLSLCCVPRTSHRRARRRDIEVRTRRRSNVEAATTRLGVRVDDNEIVLIS